jgi:transcription termination/antitermination protein NusG
MPDDPMLTPEPEPAAPPPPTAADEAAPHHIVPAEPEPHPAAEAQTPPAPAEEPPAPPAPEPAAEEAAAPPEPPNPQPMVPATAEEQELAALEAEVGDDVGEPSNKHWYVVKVQSGREESIKEAIERRVKIERLEEFFGEIRIPVERVTEMRKGKRVVKERKLYPGYLMANVEYNDRILYLFRETSGVGDFVGGTLNRPPPPMSPKEVARMLGPEGPGGEAAGGKEVQVKPPVERGDRVKVRDGTFAGMEGEVKEILENLNHLKVELTIFGRPVPVELEYWQVEAV